MRLRPLVRHCLLAGLASLALAGAPPGFAAGPPQGAVVSDKGRLAVKYEKTVLPNGLEVIYVEDHRLPLVAFNLWVHAGPRNESNGQTGFAHLFEHLMFAGSRHLPRGAADKIVDAAGGTDSNGSTNFDRTNYFFTLPSNQLELGLWLKSDMLGYMYDEIDGTALANQQDVVRNERRQSFENRPYGIVDEAIYQAVFPPGHPYRAAIIGSHADIQSIKLDDVKSFARTYYRPNNATLVLAGDFDPAAAKRLVARYFGSLKAGAPVPAVDVAPPKIEGEKRIQVTDRVELPRVSIYWQTPAMFKPGDADLDVASSILAGGKSGRLYKKLVYEKQVAQAVEAGQQSMSLTSLFQIEAVARPGKTLEEIQALIDAELAELARTPPSAEEVERARTAIETRMVERLEKVSSLADTINQYNQYAGDPGYIGKDLARYQAVTPASVSAAAAAYLRRDARVVAFATPGEKVLAPEVPASPPPVADAAPKARESLNVDEAWRAKAPKSAKSLKLSLPAGQRFTLSNGLTVVHVPKPGLPLVSAALVVRAGQIANPPGQPGLAGFTAAMLQEGTKTRSSQQIADQLADLGATLASTSRPEDARIELTSLKSSFAKGLTLLADVALNPVFDPAEIERQKADRLASLAQQRESPQSIAAIVSNRAIYGEGHPLAISSLGNEAAIQAVDKTALASFWQTHYRPDQAALVVGGDITQAELKTLAESLFGGWKAPDGAAALRQPPAPRTADARLIFVDKPGSPQTVLSVVSPGPRANVVDAESIRAMNAAFGGMFTSRVNTQLREVKGYTYGANSSFTMGREMGLFAIRSSVRTDVTGPALVDMFKEVDSLRTAPLGLEELNRARNNRLLSLPGRFDTNGAVVDSYANDWSLGLAADHIVKLPSLISAVTQASAYKATEQYVDPMRLIVVAVGDKAKVLPQLESFGRKPMEMRDIAGNVLK